MDTVRRIFLSLFFILIMPSALLADALDNELPNDTPLQIKEMAREVISLGVQDHGVIKMTRTMLQNRFSEQQMIRAYEILGEAKRNGLSEKPVMDKLYEGIGKRVQAEHIIKAMETVRERYQTASKLAHQMSGNGEQAGILTGHIAESLSAGMAGNDISRIGGVFTNLKLKNNMEEASLQIQTFMTAKTMARMGARSASVVHTIQSALKNGYDQEKMRGLEKAFFVQARAKHNPSEIAETFSRGIESGTSVEEMGRQGYMNSANNMGSNSFGSGFGSGSGAGGMGGAGGAAGGSGSGGMGGSGGSGAGHGSGGGGGGGRR